MKKRDLNKLKAAGKAISANIRGKRRNPYPWPLSVEKHLAKLAASIDGLSQMRPLMAEMSADKSRLAFLAAKNPELEHEAIGLRAVIREHEGTIARLSKELDDWRKRRG